MALPKALLCLLGKPNESSSPEEAALRAAGFATAALFWKEITAQQRGWMELAPILEDTAIQAWVFAGKSEDITPELRSQIALLTLSLERPHPPATAVIIHGDGPLPEFSGLLSHVQVFAASAPFAGKLMAARFKAGVTLPKPFHVRTHVDPLLGQWVEAGPMEGDTWQGFMAGVAHAAETEGVPAVDITAFGVGPRGVLPSKSTLEYPLRGIKGDFGDTPFVACAAKNTLTDKESCYLRVEGSFLGLMICGYPEQEEDDAQDREASCLLFS